jgi:mono/diheme cytochrome c family protein
MRFGYMAIPALLGAALATGGAQAEGYSKGEALFNANCAVCHGAQAAGTGKGPPLVHRIYEPNHHGDMAFLLAARNGVRQHHWPFGDMPPVEGVSDADVALIVVYVRELQRAAGIE